MSKDKIDDGRRDFLTLIFSPSSFNSKKQKSDDDNDSLVFLKEDKESDFNKFRKDTFEERSLKAQQTIAKYTKLGVISAITVGGISAADKVYKFIKNIEDSAPKSDLTEAKESTIDQNKLRQISELIYLHDKDIIIKLKGSINFNYKIFKYQRRSGCLNPRCKSKNKIMQLDFRVQFAHPIEFVLSEFNLYKKTPKIKLMFLPVSYSVQKIGVYDIIIRQDNLIKFSVHEELCSDEMFWLEIYGYDELGNTLYYKSPNMFGNLR